MDWTRYQGRPLDFARDAGIELLPWQQGVVSELLGVGDDGRTVYEQAAVSVHRQGGKSFLLAFVGVYRFVVYPGDTLTAAQGVDGSRRTIKYARSMFRGNRELSRAVKMQRDRFLLVGTPFEWEITSSDALQVRSKSPRCFLGDEAGWWPARSEMLDTVTPAMGAQDQPLLVLASTRGHKDSPLESLLSLGAKHEVGVYAYLRTGTEIVSPLIKPEYVERERRRMSRMIADREWSNILHESESEYATESELRAAYSDHGRPGDGPVWAFADLAGSGVASAAVASKREDGTIHVRELQVWRGSRAKPVSLASVEDWIERMAKRYQLEVCEIESWQGQRSVEALAGKGLPVRAVPMTAQRKAAQLGNLQRLLQEKTIALPRNQQLRDELEGASAEPSSVGIKVTSTIHLDLTISVSGAALLATEEAEGPASVAEFSFPGMAEIMARHNIEATVNERPALSFPDQDHAARVARFERDTGQDYNVAAWTDPHRTADALYPPTVDEVKQREKQQRQREREEAKYVKEVMAAWPDNEPYAMAQLPDGSRLLHRKECSSVAALLVMYGRGEITDFLTLNEKYTDGVPRHDCCSPVEAEP